MDGVALERVQDVVSHRGLRRGDEQDGELVRVQGVSSHRGLRRGERTGRQHQRSVRGRASVCAGRRWPSWTVTRRRTGLCPSACAGRLQPSWTMTRRANRTAASAISAGVAHGASRVASLGTHRTVRGRPRGEQTGLCVSACGGRLLSSWKSCGINSGESSSSTYATPLGSTRGKGSAHSKCRVQIAEEKCHRCSQQMLEVFVGCYHQIR